MEQIDEIWHALLTNSGVLIVGNEIRCSFGDRALYVYNTINSTNKKEEPANLSEEKEENE